MTDLLDALDPPQADWYGRGLPRVRPGEVALMFSGGIDSTATAVMLAERHPKVHLVTYKNGYGHYYFHRTAQRARELKRKLGPERFSWSLISTKGYFDEILVGSVLRDYQQYRSGFIWFMGCKMAMHMRSVIHCLEHGIPVSTDGSNSDTNEMVEQMLISLSLVRGFYEEHAVDFGTPVYDVTRDASRQYIASLGLKMGIQLMDRHLCIQPTCIAGELYYMPYLLFNKRVKHDEETVAQFIAEKQAIARRIVERWFADRGVDLDQLLEDRRRQLADLGLARAV